MEDKKTEKKRTENEKERKNEKKGKDPLCSLPHPKHSSLSFPAT